MIYEYWNKTGGTITTFDAYGQREDNLLGLAASIGASPDGEYYYNNIDPGILVGAKWKGYHLELLGIAVGKYSEIGISPDVSSRTRSDMFQLIRMFPFETFSPPGYPDYIIRPCRIRAYYEGIKLFAERILYGDDEGISIKFQMPRLVAGLNKAGKFKAEEFQDWHFDPQFLRQDLEHIVKGLDLLRDHVKKTGKAKGSRTYSEADFFEAAVEAYCRYYERTAGKRPADYQLAEEMHLSKSAFDGHKRDYGIRQNRINAEAMRRINSES